MLFIRRTTCATIAAAGILAVVSQPTLADDATISSPVPPAPPEIVNEYEAPSIADRLEWLESQNQDLQQQLNNLGHMSGRQTIVHQHFRKHLHSPKPAGVFAGVDYLRWAYRQPGVEYGISDVGGVQDRGASGNVLSIQNEYDSGFRASIGYRFNQDCNCLFNRPELVFSYTQFETDLSDQRIGSLRASFITSDNSENNDSDDINTLGVETITPDDRATSATARVAFEYNVYDLEFAQALELTPTLTLRVSAGARAAVVEEQFDVTYTGGDFQTPYQAFRNWDYSGAGGLIGANLDWAVKDGLSLNFGVKTGAVLGRYESRHFFPDDEPGVPTDVRHGETKVTPFAEIAGGVQYQREIGRALVTVGAGYEIVNWFGMADNRTFSDSHIEGQNIKSVQDLSLDGMYARIGIDF